MTELYIIRASKKREEEIVDCFTTFSCDTKDTYEGTEERYSASQPESDWDPSKYMSENLLL